MFKPLKKITFDFNDKLRYIYIILHKYRDYGGKIYRVYYYEPRYLRFVRVHKGGNVDNNRFSLLKKVVESDIDNYKKKILNKRESERIRKYEKENTKKFQKDFDHFSGVVTKRKDLIRDKAIDDMS